MERRNFLKTVAATGLLSSADAFSLAETNQTAAVGKRGERHLLIAFSWGTGDLGGIGIVPGLLNLVKKADPGLPTTVMTMQTRASASYRFLKDYLPNFMPECQVTPCPRAFLLKSPGSAWDAFVGRWGETKLRQFESGAVSAREAGRIARDVLDGLAPDLAEELEREDPEAARAFSEAGFLLYPSGTTLNFGRAGKRVFWTKRYWMPLLMAHAFKIPYGIAGQSFDALNWPSDLVYRPLFRDARFVYCRDTDSLAYLRQRDLLNANSGFRPDSTFFFDGRDEAWADAFLQSHGLESGSFMSVVARFAETHGPIAGVLAKREQGHLDKYRQLIEGWIEKTGMSVLICPEARGEIPHMQKKLYGILSSGARVKCVCMDSFWTPEQACSVYQRSRIVVGHMHTMIFALAVGTPVLHIPYAEAGRKAWMIRDIGLGDWLLDIDDTPAETILESAMAIHQKHDAARKRVRQAKREIERLGLEMMAEVKLGWRG